MQSIKNGKRDSELAIRELFLSPLIFLPSDLPSRKSIMHHRFSSDPNFGEQLRKYDLTTSRAETTDVAASDEYNNPPISASCGPKRILIDDDHDISLFHKVALEPVGFVVDVLSDPLTGLMRGAVLSMRYNPEVPLFFGNSDAMKMI